MALLLDPSPGQALSGPLTATGRSVVICILALIMGMSVISVGHAETWYTVYGRWTTQQIMYESTCWRSDTLSGVGPCYKAVWANSWANGAYTSPDDIMWQESWGYVQDESCYQWFCTDYYSVFSSPEYRADEYYVSDYLVHYTPGHLGQNNPANVIGETYHRNLTLSTTTYWYTESKLLEWMQEG